MHNLCGLCKKKKQTVRKGAVYFYNTGASRISFLYFYQYNSSPILRNGPYLPQFCSSIPVAVCLTRIRAFFTGGMQMTMMVRAASTPR